MIMPTFTTYDGTELSYRVHGQGEPLICLAGGPMRDAAYLGDLGGLAAHRTLQLPAVVTVTNLENGRSLTLRVNDRGPANPGRVIGLSDRAADLLGVPAGGAAQVRVTVDGDRSRALSDAVPGREVTQGAEHVGNGAPTGR